MDEIFTTLLLLIHTVSPRLSDVQGNTISTLYVYLFIINYHFPDKIGALSKSIIASAWNYILLFL